MPPKDTRTNFPPLPISIIADMLGIHQRTLRIYDKEGILVPKRTDKNRRMYTKDDCERLKLVQFLTRNLVLNLSSVKIVLAFLEDIKIEPENYISYINNLAKKANITPEAQQQNIYNIENNKSFPSIPLLHKLYTKYNININYLIAGKEPMFIDNINNPSIRKEILNAIDNVLKMLRM